MSRRSSSTRPSLPSSFPQDPGFSGLLEAMLGATACFLTFATTFGALDISSPHNKLGFWSVPAEAAEPVTNEEPRFSTENRSVRTVPAPARLLCLVYSSVGSGSLPRNISQARLKPGQGKSVKTNARLVFEN